MDTYPPVPPLAETIFRGSSHLSATRWERPLPGPWVGEVRHHAANTPSFFFDNRGETPTGIIVRNEGEIVKFQSRDLGFEGVDKSVSVEGERVTVHIPGLVFDPALQVRFNGGPFHNQAFAEKGYAAASISITWAANDPDQVPIIDADQLALNGLPIDLDAGWTITNGGTYTPTDLITEEVEGSGVSVRLHAAIETVTRTAGLQWLTRLYWGNSISPAMDQTTIKGLSNAALAASRLGIRSYTEEAGAYKWFCYPTAFGYARPLDDFVDVDTNFKVPMEEPQIVPVTNTYGYTTDYYAYRTTFQAGGAINVRIL